MATVVFLALSPSGAEQSGEVEAATETDAMAQLRQRGLMPLEIESGRRTRGRGSWPDTLGRVLPRGWMPPRAADVVMLLRQVALMLRAGHTVVLAIEACIHLSHKYRMRDALAAIAAGIERGASLSAAMRGHRMFNPFMIRMVEAGEASGEMDTILDRLADDLERKTELRRQLITSLTYPGIVVLGSIGVVAFLSLTVIPRFGTFLQARGGQLPWAASVLMSVTAFLQQHGAWLLAGFVGAIAAFILARRVPGTRVMVDRMLLHMPVIARPMLTAAMTQICWTISLLLRSGLPVLDAVRASGQACRNAALAHAMQCAADDVLAGRGLAQAMDKPGVPYLLRHMAHVGQHSGELDAVLDTLGSYYRRELDVRIRLMSALIEPVLIVLVGGIVGFVYFAFFQAVFAVSTGGGR